MSLNSLVDLFNLGMMRDYNEIIPDKQGIVLNIGAGEKLIDGSIPLDYPEYDAESDRIPWANETVDMIHCYHMMEHINDVPFFIQEVRRVLKPGGHMNIVVPYYNSNLQAQDLDHKTAFNERSFERLFETTYYFKGKVDAMEIATNFIMGDCEANLCLIVQLRKYNV